MIWVVDNPDFTKSSVFSLLSTAIAMTVNNSMQKTNVVKNFCSMYQSIFVIISSEVKTNLKKEMIKALC
jgi:hypothetical protein